MFGPKDKGYPAIPNKVFAAQDRAFRDACENAGVEPTARQASKWRNSKGRAFRAHKSKAVE